MSEINEHITALIVAQLSGSASEAELEELHQWLTSDADNARIYTQVKHTYWSRPNQSSNEKRVDVLNRIKQRTEHPIEKQIPPAQPQTRRVFLYGAAAAILVAFLAGWWFTHNNTVSVQAAQIEKFCPRGKKLHFNLPDGSEVWLNADSKLSFPENFAEDIRSLNLTGEAFFKVKRNVNKPFVVATENARIEVLGTSFNINSRTESNVTKTSVVSGSVKVSDSSCASSVTLVKNQQVEVTTAGELGDIAEVNAEELTGWTSNR